MAFGGANEYSGRSMRDAHREANAGGFPTEAQFGIVAEILVATLKELKVPQNFIDEIVAVALTVKDDVTGKEGKKDQRFVLAVWRI